jgi:hypothetical protein
LVVSLGGLLLLSGIFLLGRVSAEKSPEPKNNLPLQKSDNPEPSPGDKKEGKFDYVTFLKEGNTNYCIFRDIHEGANPRIKKLFMSTKTIPELKSY